MIHRTTPSISGRGRSFGFTLVELLVVIVIVIVLATFSFNMMRNARASAQTSTCISRLRNATTLLLATAADNNGRVRAFSGGSGGFDYRPYFIVGRELGLDNDSNNKTAYESALREVMFCPSAPGATTVHWNCYGVNFTNSEQASATWINEKIKDASGRTANVKALNIASVGNPAGYVLVADSCQSSGQQVFRISGADRIGLRHKHKANACFLDGSAQSLTASELGKLGFKEAYDTSTNPPKSISLPQNP